MAAVRPPVPILLKRAKKLFRLFRDSRERALGTRSLITLTPEPALEPGLSPRHADRWSTVPVLVVVDEFTWEQFPARSAPCLAPMARELDVLIAAPRPAEMIASDNAAELTSRGILLWQDDHTIGAIALGKPMHNDFVWLNGRFHDQPQQGSTDRRPPGSITPPTG